MYIITTRKKLIFREVVIYELYRGYLQNLSILYTKSDVFRISQA